MGFSYQRDAWRNRQLLSQRLTEPQGDLFALPPTDNRVVWLELLLKENTGWMTSADIVKASSAPISDREVRARASASSWVISGQKGYKHLDHATAEEITHAANWLESQAKKMGERAQQIRRNAHAKLA